VRNLVENIKENAKNIPFKRLVVSKNSNFFQNVPNTPAGNEFTSGKMKNNFILDDKEKLEKQSINDDNIFGINVEKKESIERSKDGEENKEMSKKKMFCQDLIDRNLYISSFWKHSGYNPRYKKMTLLITQISVMLLIICIILTIDSNSLIGQNITKVFFYCILTSTLSNIIVLPLVYFFRTSDEVKERLYNLLEQESELTLLYEWKQMNSSNVKRSTIGFLINVILLLFAFYYTFGFCLIWVEWSTTLILCMIITLVFDAVILEILYELCVLLCYSCKDVKLMAKLFYKLDRFKNIKALI